jgi:hypothetical protein
MMMMMMKFPMESHVIHSCSSHHQALDAWPVGLKNSRGTM